MWPFRRAKVGDVYRISRFHIRIVQLKGRMAKYEFVTTDREGNFTNMFPNLGEDGYLWVSKFDLWFVCTLVERQKND